LGRGAFAAVYLARQRSMKRMVALKVSADRGTEPQMLAQMDHPNIVRVYDQRTLPDRKLRLLYMQYVAGGTLQSAHEDMQRVPTAKRNGAEFLKAIDRTLEEHGETPPTDSSNREKLGSASWPQVVCWLGARIATALAHAHQCGVLHRDLKPANVLVAADGNPKLADFNISFSSKLEGATPAAYFGGSLSYMSPEQLEACNPKHDREPDELDGRCDVYSLGILLWELLTGDLPFASESPSSDWSITLGRMAERRRQGVSPQAIARLPSNIPSGLKETLLKCLTPDAADRLNAAEAARQFELCLQPRAQKLLHGTDSLWQSVVRNYPTWTVVVGVISINMVLGILNIVYNAALIVRYFNATARDVFWWGQIPAINAVCYTVGTVIILRVGWPVFSGVRPNPPAAPSEGLMLARARCLRLGDYLAGVVITLWIVSGIVPPVWLAIVQNRSGGEVKISSIAHFFMSQCLCGLIATTMSYFYLTFLTVRYFYPKLLTRDLADHAEVVLLASLSRRIWLYYLLAVAVPFLAALLLISNFSADLKTFVIILIVLGLVGFSIAYAVDRVVRDDLAALAMVVNPGGSSLALSDTSDSFLTRTRT
jgi:serine/threonine protein kinase